MATGTTREWQTDTQRDRTGFNFRACVVTPVPAVLACILRSQAAQPGYNESEQVLLWGELMEDFGAVLGSFNLVWRIDLSRRHW